jgi:hypothetical protein
MRLSLCRRQTLSLGAKLFIFGWKIVGLFGNRAIPRQGSLALRNRISPVLPFRCFCKPALTSYNIFAF